MSEQSISEFNALTTEEFLAVTANSVYVHTMEYVCFHEDGKPFYVPVNDFGEGPIYDVFEGLDGRGARFITFYEGYTTKLLDACGLGVILFYESYAFDESTQQLASEAIDGHWVKGNVYTLAYADADHIVLESEIHDAAIERCKLPSGRGYFIREVLVRHIGELKEPTEIRDNRK